MNIIPRLHAHTMRTTTQSAIRRLCLLTVIAATFTLINSIFAAPPELATNGNQIVVKSSGEPVRLTGVNIPSLEWGTGEYIMTSLEVAVGSWKANVIRLPASEARWFGSSAQSYRATVDAFIARASELNVYVILDLHEYQKSLDAHATFWTDAANRYKNNDAVLFGLLNEPYGTTWDVWRNGDADGPGIQGLLDTVRATGANNIVLAGGLDWAFDLRGILEGYSLSETASGNGIVYDAHVYPWKGSSQLNIGNVAQEHPVLLGELGHPGGTQFAGMTFEDESIWVPKLLNWADSHNLHWTGWSFYPGADPKMLSDWNHSPSSHWGTPAKEHLLAYKNPDALRVVGGTVIGITGNRNNPNSGILTYYARGAVAAFDDRYTTYYEAAAASGDWTGLELTTPTQITQIQYMPADGHGDLMLGGVFEGSNSADFSSGVTELHVISAEPDDTGNAYTTVEIFDTNTFQYVRYVGPDGAYCTVASILFYTGHVTTITPEDDVIVLDDTSPSVTVTGNWGYSTVAGRYAASTRYDTISEKGANSSVRYTPTITSPGLYEVLGRWNAYSNRSQNTPIDINDLNGTTTVTVNQRLDGGQWNSLGVYAFDTGTSGNVLVRTDGTQGYVIADAFMFRKVSDLNVEVEIILDNTHSNASGVEQTGNWITTATVPGYWADGYMHDGDSNKGGMTVRFSPNITDAGDYDVFVLWTGRSYNASSVPVTVTYTGGSDTHTIDQTSSGGEWHLLGSYSFAAGSSGNVLFSNTGTSGRVVVDAVRFHKNATTPDTTLTIDTEDQTGVTLNGDWYASTSVLGYLGSNYLHDGNTNKGNSSVVFSPTITEPGIYDVFMNWPTNSNRATSVPVEIVYATGTDSLTINQQSYGGARNYLGSYYFDVGTGGSITISNGSDSGYVIADSVRLELQK